MQPDAQVKWKGNLQIIGKKQDREGTVAIILYTYVCIRMKRVSEKPHDKSAAFAAQGRL